MSDVDNRTAPTRVQHHDLDAEKALIGCLVLNADRVPEVSEIVTSADFYNWRHGIVFDAVLAQHHDRQPTELPLVAARLIDQGDCDRVGGAVFLHDCVALAQSPGSAVAYAHRVREVADRRRLAELAATAGALTATGAPAADVHARLREALDKAAPRTEQASEFTDLADMIPTEFERIEKAPTAHASIIKTGFPDLDKLVRIRPQQFVVVGARPGHGKSLLVLDIARHAAYRQGIKVAFMSMEMSKPEVFARALSAESGVFADNIDTGRMSDDDWAKAAKAARRMSDGTLLVSELSGLTLAQVETRAHMLVERHGIGLLVLDYLQLIKGPEGNRTMSRQQELGLVTRGLKALAARLNIPILAAAQLNRDTDKRPDKRPQMSDFREAGDIENDANIAMLIHNFTKADPEGDRAGEADIIVAKNRSGSDGVVVLAAQFSRSRFASVA